MLFRESGESPRVYLVERQTTGQPASWFAFLLAAGTSGPPWGALQPADTLGLAGYYVTCPRRPASVSAFVAAATEVLEDFARRKGVTNRSASWFTWFADPDASGAQMGLQVLSVTKQGQFFLTDAVSPNVTVRDVVLSITAGAGVTYDGGANRFRIFAGAGLSLSVGGQGHTVGTVDQHLSVPVLGMQQGCVLASCKVSRWNDFDLISPSVSLYVPDTGGTSLQQLRFPLFAGSAIGNDGVALDLALDPSTPESPQRTGFTFQGSPALPSFLRTTMGEVVTLAPQGARIGFANCPQRLDGPVAQPAGLTPYPSGAFAVATAPATGGKASKATGGSEPARLVFGLSGSEYFEVPGTGTVLEFLGGKPALLTFSLGEGAPPPVPGGDLLATGRGGATTAWAQVSSPDAGATYHAQPQAAPLFAAPPPAAPAAASVTLLEPQVTTAWTGGATPLVPLVPYASAAGTGQGSELRALEQRAVALVRQRAMIGAGRGARAAAALRLGAGTGERQWSTDHRGFRVGLDDGRPAAVTLASTPSAPGGPLVDLTLEIAQPVVAEALLGEQVFLVATTTVDSTGKPLFGFDGSLYLAGWQAEPRLASTWDAQAAVGETTPMMIVKLGPRSVADLAASLDEWTDPQTFLPQPAGTQEALQALIEAAIHTVGGARAPAGPAAPTTDAALFADFVRVVTDPGWTGVLFLNARLGQAPPVIRGVLSGVPAEDLRWHHAGVSFSRVKPDSTLSPRGSATFGLVDYTSDTTPSLEGAGYTFWTRWLQALFVNSALTSFNCRVALGLMSFFGVPLAVRQQGAGGSGSSKPVIEISGVYQERSSPGGGDGATGVYSFITTEEHTFDFDYSAATSLVTAEILTSITLTKVQLGPGGATSEQITSDFLFWGTLAFGQIVKGGGVGLDVFNFDALPFGSLVLSMTAPAGGGPPDAWAIETGEATFDLDAANLRPGGLVGSLPLDLRGLRYEPQAFGLDGLGYLPLGLPPGNPDQAAAVTAALVYSVDLGRPGTLGSAQPIVASVLAGWTTDGGVLLGISLPGLGSDSTLKFEGVMKLVLGAFRLNQVTPPAALDAAGASKLVTLEVDSCTYELLGVQFPQPPMSLTLVIADPGASGEVLWYAGWPPPPPPSTAAPGAERALAAGGLGLAPLAPRPPAPVPARPGAGS